VTTPCPSEGFVLTHFLVAEDVARSRNFLSDAGRAGDQLEAELPGPLLELGVELPG
jgi:hypothetical protein